MWSVSVADVVASDGHADVPDALTEGPELAVSGRHPEERSRGRVQPPGLVRDAGMHAATNDLGQKDRAGWRKAVNLKYAALVPGSKETWIVMVPSLALMDFM